MSPLTDYHVIVQIQLNEALMGPRLGLPKIRWPLGCSLLVVDPSLCRLYLVSRTLERQSTRSIKYGCTRQL